MRKRFFSILQYVLFLGGGIFLVWWQLKSMTEPEQKEFEAALNHANYWIVIPIAVMAILSHISRSMRWKLLMEPLGYNPGLKNVFAVTMVGYLANAAIPRLGEILKCTFLARYEKLKADKLIGTIIVERSFDLICYMLFIAATILIQVNAVGGYFRSEMEMFNAAKGLPLWVKFLIALTSVVVILVLARFLSRKYPGNKLIRRIQNIIRGIGEGFQSIRRLKHRKAFIGHTLFIWLMYLLQIYLGFSAMEGVSHLGIKAACSVLSLATLSMIVTPGGIGSFPIFVMQTLRIYGIEAPLGKAFGWLMWGVSTGIIVIVGLVALMALPYLNKKKNENSTGHSPESVYH
jgi:uncharacterized protein (TIRG00374 family)